MSEKHFTASFKTLTTTGFALTAFAANSVLCRLALGDESIDPASFTVIRMLSGAVALILVVILISGKGIQPLLRSSQQPPVKRWLSASMLFIYALFFSFAYTQLSTASGALILFATVQLSMIGYEVSQGKKLSLVEISGILISFSGFAILMLPSATQPSVGGFFMMLIAGVAWAVYTICGKSSTQPLLDTANNFIRCIPITLLLLGLSVWQAQLSWPGISLAIASGAVASGIGYAIWYSALKNLNITQAAISQLAVPIIAALGGVLLVGESLTISLIIATVLILSGIAMVSLTKRKPSVY